MYTHTLAFPSNVLLIGTEISFANIVHAQQKNQHFVTKSYFSTDWNQSSAKNGALINWLVTSKGDLIKDIRMGGQKFNELTLKEIPKRTPTDVQENCKRKSQL